MTDDIKEEDKFGESHDNAGPDIYNWEEYESDEDEDESDEDGDEEIGNGSAGTHDKCKICGKPFKNKYYLRRHMRIHMGKYSSVG